MTKVNAFLQSVDKQPGLAAEALKLVIYTASRSNKVLGAAWDEIDFENKVWSISAERMKGGKEHRVPLTSPALSILKELKKDRDKYTEEDKEPNPYAFPSPKGNTSVECFHACITQTDEAQRYYRAWFPVILP